MISTRGVKDRSRDIIAAKLISPAVPAANRDEKCGAEASVKTDCVI